MEKQWYTSFERDRTEKSKKITGSSDAVQISKPRAALFTLGIFLFSLGSPTAFATRNPQAVPIPERSIIPSPVPTEDPAFLRAPAFNLERVGGTESPKIGDRLELRASGIQINGI